MKMKIVIVLAFFSFLVFISYLQTNKKEINYTILGNKELFSNNLKSVNFTDLVYKDLDDKNLIGFYSKDFIRKDIRTIDVINDIDNNISIDNITIQNILKRTNILVLSIGNNEISYKLSKIDKDINNDSEIYKYLDEVVNDVSVLIDKIKKLNECQIIVLGYYNDTGNIENDKYYSYINQKMLKRFNSKNIDYINLFEILNKNSDYLTKTNPTYITNEGNMAIYSKIISKIDELHLHNIN